MSASGGYLQATRHPWPSWLFVLPLLLVYEVGVRWLGGEQGESLRNGADHWVRLALRALGLKMIWVPPALLALGFSIWMWRRRKDRPGRIHEVLGGMLLESAVLALGLWLMSRALLPLLHELDVRPTPSDPAGLLSTSPATPPEKAVGLREVLPFLGAGIYEEALFRLALHAPLFWLLRRLDLPLVLAFVIAALGSAILFSAAHHLGPYGQEYTHFLFVFRLLAGVYFALIFQLRGFGVAVGTHACYNVMVSVGVV